MINGPTIALRIEYLLSDNPKKSRTQLGMLMYPNNRIGARGARKRVSEFLNAMKHGHFFSDLNVIAGYLEVSAEYLVTGRMPEISEKEY